MLVWLTLPFYDFCGFRSVAVNSVYKLQFFYIYKFISPWFPEDVYLKKAFTSLYNNRNSSSSSRGIASTTMAEICASVFERLFKAMSDGR